MLTDFFKGRNALYPVLISLFALTLFLPFLGRVNLFDWDEVNFAESAREMIVSGDYLTVRINYQPFWEKPPLFIWMQVLSMHLFGINEFAARFPNAVAGVCTIFLLWFAGRRIFSTRFAILWIALYLGSMLPFFYFRSGIIDPWFNLFIFAGILFLIFFLERRKEEKGIPMLIFSALSIGLAILTKGPVAVLILMLTFIMWLAFNKFRLNASVWHVVLYFILVALTGGFWFLLQIANGNMNLVLEFIRYQIRLFSTQDAGHGGFFLYHVVVLLFGVFPASVLAVPVLFGKQETDNSLQKQSVLWLQILFWIVLVLFSIVKTKIVHYSSLCYFPLTFLAAYYVNTLIENRRNYPHWQHTWLWIQSLILAMIPALAMLVIQNRSRLLATGWIKDPFAAGNLQADVTFSGIEWAGGAVLLVCAAWASLHLKTRQYLRGTLLLLAGTLAFTWFSMTFFTSRIEAFSQRAAIDFYKSKQKEKCLVMTLGFKSYANLFYAARMPEESNFTTLGEELYKGKAGIPVYAVTKISKKEKYLKLYPLLRVLYEKNGFVFMQVVSQNSTD